MRYKTAFRLAMRGLGAAIALWQLPTLGGGVFTLLLEFINGGTVLGFVDGWWWMSYMVVQPLLGLLLGVWLFRNPNWIVDRAVPSNRPYCHECGYELTGLAREGACPECGVAFRGVGAGGDMGGGGAFRRPSD